jgi:hypothetical protein
LKKCKFYKKISHYSFFYIALLLSALLYSACNQPFSFSDILNGLDDTVGSATGSFPDIDYIVESISNSAANADVNSPLSQSFIIENMGSDTGDYLVYWTAYISLDQILDGADTPLNTGVITALSGTTLGETITITGTWPASAGVYYLIVNVSAGDDVDPSNNIFSSESFTITAVPGVDIDYVVSDISINNPSTTLGSPFSEEFALTNTGGLNGAELIAWTAYASANNTLEAGTDIVIGFGSTVYFGLDTGESDDIIISGFWPNISGDYYLIVSVESGDETITDNNTNFCGLFTVQDPPDYSISSTTIQLEGTAGIVLNDSGIFNFTIDEISGNDGSKPIFWEVFASLDEVLDGNDILIKEGSLGAITAFSSSGLISFADGIWPLWGSDYFLIIDIFAVDDSNNGNNINISVSSVYVPEVYIEGVEDNSDSGPVTGTLSNVSDLGTILLDGTIERNEKIEVKGIMDADGSYDTYKFLCGSEIGNLSVSAEWNTGTDALDYYIWSTDNNEWSSTDGTNDSEGTPATPVMPDEVFYIGVFFKAGTSEGSDYKLIIVGKN